MLVAQTGGRKTGLLVNNQFEQMCKEPSVVGIKFGVISWHFPAGSEKNQEITKSRQSVSGPRLKQMVF